MVATSGSNRFKSAILRDRDKNFGPSDSAMDSENSLKKRAAQGRNERISLSVLSLSMKRNVPRTTFKNKAIAEGRKSKRPYQKVITGGVHEKLRKK